MALERAYQDAGFAPSSVGLIEAHGTGTVAGDPPEFAALNEVFGNSQQAAYCSRERQISDRAHQSCRRGSEFDQSCSGFASQDIAADY